MLPNRGYRSRTLPAVVANPLSARVDTAPGRSRPALVGRLAAHPDVALLGAVLLVGGLLRAAFWLRATVFIIPDSENYFLPGFQLARGLGFELEPRRAPIYPLFIAGVVQLMGQDLAALALAQHTLGVTTVGLSYALARVTFGRLAALLAGLMVALNGSLLIAEQTISTETLFTTLLALAALIGVLGVRARSPRQLLLCGIVLGLAALTRPVAIGLLPALPLALAAIRPGWRRWLSLSLLYVVGFAATLLPWMLRNYLTLQVFSTEGAFGQTLVGRTVRHDRFVFVDPGAPADADPRRQQARELMQDAADRGSFITPLRRRLMRDQGLTELEANRLMRDLAVEAILRQPGYYLTGTARFFVTLALGWPDRLKDAWESRVDPDAREEWESHPEIAGLLGPPAPAQGRQLATADALTRLYQPGRVGAPLLALFAIGLVAALAGLPNWRLALLPALWAVGLLLIAVAFVGPVLRYRYPAEPFLAVVAAGGVVALLTAARRSRQLIRRRERA